MTNLLAMLKSREIQWLAEAGQSEREIAEALGVSRGAVRRHLGREGSKRTKAPTGSEAGFEAGLGESRSLCVGLRDQILAKLEQGLTAERIY